MSYGLFLPRRWTRQPQGPVEVDWGNPLSRDLVVSWLATRPVREIANGLVASARGGGGTPAAGSLGVCLKTNSSDYIRFNTFPGPLSTARASRISGVVALRVGHTNVIGTRDADGGWGFTPRIDGTRTMRFTTFFVEDHDFVDVGPEVLTETTAAFTYEAGAANGVRVFWGGRKVGSVDASVIEALGTGQTFVGGADDVTVGDNQIACAHIFKRTLLDAEAIELTVAPYQLYKPRRPVIYSFPSGGITIPTLSLPGVQDITATGARPKVTLTF